MPLNEAIVRNAEPRPKPYKMFDGGGLYLAIQPGGSKLWRLRYRYDGKEGLLSFGTHPPTSLASARRRRERTRQLLATGRDPRLACDRQGDSGRFRKAEDALARNPPVRADDDREPPESACRHTTACGVGIEAAARSLACRLMQDLNGVLRLRRVQTGEPDAQATRRLIARHERSRRRKP